MRIVEAAVFLTLASAVHLAALSLSDLPGGGTPAGYQGADDITLRAADGQIAALAAQWQTAPAVAPTTEPLTATPAAQPAPTSPQPLSANPEVTPPPAPLPPNTAADAIPDLDTRLPAPRGLVPVPPKALTNPALPQPQTLAQPAVPRPLSRDYGQAQSPAPPPITDALDSTPRIDTRLPAPRGVVPALPEALTTPALPQPQTLTQPAKPHSPTAPQQPNAPRVAALTPEALPQIDRIPNSSAQAPATSRRPALRPADLAPPVVQAKPKAAPQPKAAPPRPAQKARGSGTSATPAAKPKPKPAPGPSAGQLRQAQAEWGARIRSAVARAQRSPSGRATGTVKLRLTVSPKGRLQSVAIVRSSGHAALDRAAIQAAKRARLPRAPKVLSKSSYSFNLPLRFATR
ncbi:MAG: TonB family protein [Paracoccaceae bacterium]|nr:TonB family protein [Paracoccaceae bacterium]